MSQVHLNRPGESQAVHGLEHSQVAEIRSLPPRTGNGGRSHPEKPKSPRGREQAVSTGKMQERSHLPCVGQRKGNGKKVIEEVEFGI